MKTFLRITALVTLISCNALAETTPQAPAADPFMEMLAYVYQQNPKLNSERESLKIADEKVSQANAGYRPTLNADADAGRQREKIGSDAWLYGPDAGGEITAIQPLFSGFGTLEQKRAAEARVLAARARLLSIEQNILFTAIDDWMEICEKEKVLALNEDNLRRISQFSDATEERFKAGDATKTDLAQAESRVAQAQARQAVALADRDSARATFERDTGMPFHSIDFPPLPPTLPASREEAESAAANNPQLAQARQEEEATSHDIGSAESSLWPSIYLRGNMSEERSPSLGLERLRDDSVTINASIPLYQGGAEYSRIREAKLAHEKSHYDAIDASRDVLERSKLAWNNYQSAQSVISASQKASDAAERALGGVLEEQKQGLRTLTEVLDEQSEFLNAQVNETQAQKNLRLEAYRLLAATGRLTGDGLHLATTPYDPVPHHDDVVPRWVGTDISQWQQPQ